MKLHVKSSSCRIFIRKYKKAHRLIPNQWVSLRLKLKNRSESVINMTLIFSSGKQLDVLYFFVYILHHGDASMSWKRVVQKIYKCDLNNLSSITTLWFIVLLIMLQEEVITHIMNVYIMLLMCDVTISWVFKLVRFFQLPILLITYCCQFLAFKKNWQYDFLTVIAYN